MNELAEKYGRKSILFNCFYCGTPGNKGSITDILSNRFLNVYGATKLEYEAVDYAIVMQDLVDGGIPMTAGRDLITANSSTIFIWGGNPIGFTRPARVTRMFLDARDRGAKIVHISNLFDNTSAKVDEWVPVKTATDAALALGMAHVLIRDNMVDEAFMLDETVGPLLVRSDTGKFLREADVKEGGDPSLFAIFDTKTSQVAFIPRQEKRHSGYGEFAPALSAEGEVNGIAYESAYTKLCKHLEKWTPEYQEKITGVPAEKCEHLAHLYSEGSPTLLCLGDGVRYANGTQSYRAIRLLVYLTGNYCKPNGGSIMTAGITEGMGGGLGGNGLIYDPSIPVDNADMVSLTDILKSFEDPEVQQYKALINAQGNPLLNWPNKDLWRTRFLPNLDLFVTIEIRFTDSCRWSDYVLPEATAFERYEVIDVTDNSVVLCEPAIDPCGEARTAADIWRGLAERVGIADYFQKTQEEWAQALVDQQPEKLKVFPEVTHGGATGAEASVELTYDLLKEKKAVHKATPDIPFDLYAVSPFFATTTGRLEFYNENYTEVGKTMADLDDAWVLNEDDKKRYPLQFFIARHKYFMQGQFTNIPEMEALAYTQFGVALNPVDAQARGLRDGDKIEVFNQRGVMKGVLHLREDVAPGICHTWYSFDETYYKDNCTPQELATPQNAPETTTPMAIVNGKLIQGVFSMVGMPKSGMFIAGETTPEVIFDQLCEIRKAE